MNPDELTLMLHRRLLVAAGAIGVGHIAARLAKLGALLGLETLRGS